MKTYKKYDVVDSTNYDQIVLQLELMGDDPDFKDNLDMQIEFEKLAELIENYDKNYYTKYYLEH